MRFFKLHLWKNPFYQLLQSTPFRYDTTIGAFSSRMCAKICFYNCSYGKTICASSSRTCQKIHFHNYCNQRLFAMVQLYVHLQFACVKNLFSQLLQSTYIRHGTTNMWFLMSHLKKISFHNC